MMKDNDLNTLNEIKKLWWLHDTFWHATVIREFGAEKASSINLQSNERFFHMLTLRLLKKRIIKRPKSIQDLMGIFITVWETCFFDDMYINDPIEYNGNTATWIGSTCQAYDSLSRSNMVEGYVCGCQAIRNGVMKALRLKMAHSIEESLIAGDDKCVIKIHFEPE